MIDKLREARDVMKDTEKYLSDILAHEWMAHHPHFHNKDDVNKIVNNLIGTYTKLSRIIDELIRIKKQTMVESKKDA
jgi:hypothetical protein